MIVKLVKRALIIFAGTVVLSLGIAMIILPGPAVLVIPAGLAILGIEFEWARRYLKKLRDWLSRKGFPPKARESVPRGLINSPPGNSA